MCTSSAHRSLSKKMVEPHREQKPRRAAGVDRYQDSSSAPVTSSKLERSTPNQVTKAAPCARRQSEQ
jgi:hypothetical protein